jgi:ABC-type branched-subunit amino acid transport system permease subunit
MHIYLEKILPSVTAKVDATFFGVMLIVILIFMPDGLAGWLEQVVRVARRTGERFSRN